MLGADDRDDLVFDQDVGVVVVCGVTMWPFWMSVFMIVSRSGLCGFAA